jgi:hypothetical protein
MKGDFSSAFQLAAHALRCPAGHPIAPCVARWVDVHSGACDADAGTEPRLLKQAGQGGRHAPRNPHRATPWGWVPKGLATIPALLCHGRRAHVQAQLRECTVILVRRLGGPKCSRSSTTLSRTTMEREDALYLKTKAMATLTEKSVIAGSKYWWALVSRRSAP